MARIYQSKSPLASLVEGYFTGKKYSDERGDRDEDVRFRNTEQRRSAEEKGWDSFRKPTLDGEGRFSGYEEDALNKAKATAYARRNLPSLQKKRSPVEAAMSSRADLSLGEPSIGLNSAEEAQKNMAARLAPPPAPPTPPPVKPLISSPADQKAAEAVITKATETPEAPAPSEAGKLAQQTGKTVKQEVGEPIRTGAVDAQGRPVAVQPVNQGVSFGDAQVMGDVPPEVPGVDPALIDSVAPDIAPEPVQEDPLDLDPYTLKKVIDQVTAPRTSKDGLTAQTVNSASLNPELQKRLGVEGLAIELPFSFVARGIQGQAGSPKEIDPAAYSFARSIQDGSMDVGTALEQFQQAVGRPANVTEVNWMTGRDKESGIDARSDKNREALKERTDKSYSRADRKDINSIIDKAGQRYMSQNKGSVEALSAAKTLDRLLSSGSTSGKEAMIATMLVKMSGQNSQISDRDIQNMGGETGLLERIQRMASKAQNEGLAPGDIKLMQKMAGDFQKSAAKVLEARSGAIRRNAVSQLSTYMDPDAAMERYDSAINPDEFVGNLDVDYGDDAPEEGAAPAASAPTQPAAPPAERQKSAQKLGITPDKLAAIAAPDPKIEEWAKKYGKSYDEAEKIIRGRGYGR